MKGKEAVTIESFDEDEYKETLREQGYKEDILNDLVDKKKASLSKNESSFEYVMKLEEIEKSETDHLIIAGFASSGSLDWDEEAINQDSLRSAWSDYMENPVLKYLHGKDKNHVGAIGKVLKSYTTKDGRIFKTEFIDGKPFIVAEISNAPDVESIRVKIREGVLKGLSIGGRANRVSEFCTKIGKNINRIFVKRMSELSIVDLPANREGMFEVIKNECVGNNCDYNNENYDGINTEIPENDMNENIQIEKTELEDNMAENNIEMEMSELKEFVKTTVSEMIADQDSLEKVEGYDAAIKEAQDLRVRIAELESKVEAMAAQLKAQPQETMKSEEVTEDEVVKTEDVIVEDDRVAKLEAELKELKESPLYKAEQDGTVEKDETVEHTSHLGSIIHAHYGGN